MLHSPELIVSFGQFLKKIGKKEATVQSYCQDLTQFLEFLTAHALSLANVDNAILLHYHNAMRENHGGKPNSFRRSVIAIRQFYRWLAKYSAMPISSLDDLVIPNRVEVVPRKLSERDIDSLLKETAKSSPLKAARDKAIIVLLCFEGIKVSELIALEWKNFLAHQNKGTLLVPGERSRLILLSDKSVQYLVQYQSVVHSYQPAIPKTYRMFLGFKGRDLVLLSSQVTRHGLKFMLYELGQACHIPHLNTEMLRHYAIQHQLSLGLASEEIMKHLGLKRIGNIAKHQRFLVKHGARN